MATPLQIGGMVNLEERSGSFLPELPYTNRGVIRQKEALSALKQWAEKWFALLQEAGTISMQWIW